MFTGIVVLFAINFVVSLFGMLIAVLLGGGLPLSSRIPIAFVVGIWLVVVGPVGFFGAMSFTIGICVSVPLTMGKLKLI